MLSLMCWTLGACAVNMAVGAGVWSAIDYEDRRFYHWYAECPKTIAWFAQPLVLTLWPVGVWLWWFGWPE